MSPLESLALFGAVAECLKTSTLDAKRQFVITENNRAYPMVTIEELTHDVSTMTEAELDHEIELLVDDDDPDRATFYRACAAGVL